MRTYKSVDWPIPKCLVYVTMAVVMVISVAESVTTCSRLATDAYLPVTIGYHTIPITVMGCYVMLLLWLL